MADARVAAGGMWRNRTDVFVAVGVIAVVMMMLIPLPASAARRPDGRQPRAVDPHHPDRALHPARPRVLRLPDAAAGDHRLRPGPERQLDPPDPLAGGAVRRSDHPGVRHFRRRGERHRGLRHRVHHLHHHHRGAVHRHHQGRHPGRGGGRALHPRRAARQADGHRGRVQLGAHHRGGGHPAEERTCSARRTSTAPWTAPRSSSRATSRSASSSRS